MPVGAKHHISHLNLEGKKKDSNAVFQNKCLGKKNCCIVPSILGSGGPEVSNATASRAKNLYLGCSLAAGGCEKSDTCRMTANMAVSRAKVVNFCPDS